MRKDVVFCNAVCKAEESALLTRDCLLRISSATLTDAVKMLYDYGYGDGIMVDDIDKLISGQSEALIRFINEYSPTDCVRDFLVAPYLFNNIKALYKQKRGGSESPLFDVDAGNISGGDYSALNQSVAAVLTELDNGNPTAREIDIALTKAMYEYKLFKAKKSGFKALIKYARAEIDTVNALTAERCKARGITPDLIIEGGEGADLSDIVSSDLTRSETQISDYLLSVADSFSGDMDGVGPLLRYVLNKSAELKTVKMILVCIKSGAQSEIAYRLGGRV